MLLARANGEAGSVFRVHETRLLEAGQIFAPSLTRPDIPRKSHIEFQLNLTPTGIEKTFSNLSTDTRETNNGYVLIRDFHDI